jgi:hypothetical protein
MTVAQISPLARARIAAEEALQRYVDACHENETMFSGWGDMVIPEAATKMRTDAQQAFLLVAGKDAE